MIRIVIPLLNVNEMRNRKVKTFNEIKALDENSTNIYYPSLIDDYSKQTKELESFVRFCQILGNYETDVKKMTKSNLTNLYQIYLKKNEKSII